MEDILRRLLEGARPDEVMDCVAILAVAITQHRAKSQAVPIRHSMEQLLSSTDAPEQEDLLKRSTEVLEDALEMARTLAAERARRSADEEEASANSAEKRRQMRVHISAPIKVLWPDDPEPVRATLENISWGGAAIQLDQVRHDSGESLRLLLPGARGGSISIEARILRSWDLADGKGQGLAARFSSLSTHDEEELEKLLTMLAQSGDSQGDANSNRSHARLAQQLDIQFEGAEELQASLADISMGGMGITVREPLQIGQSIQTIISSLDESGSIKLRARVVRQEAVKMGKIEVYSVGLKFEHPTEELDARIKEFIDRLARARGPHFG